MPTFELHPRQHSHPCAGCGSFSEPCGGSDCKVTIDEARLCRNCSRAGIEEAQGSKRTAMSVDWWIVRSYLEPTDADV